MKINLLLLSLIKEQTMEFAATLTKARYIGNRKGCIKLIVKLSKL